MTDEEKSFNLEQSQTLTDDFLLSETSDSDLSSDGLEIDISESPKCKKEIDIEDKKVLENIEEEIERQYDEKAAKSNLTAINVKNILKHVITNEHVWAMVRNTTGEVPDEEEHAFYEPKLTRAKAKELLKSQNVPAAAIPWANTTPKSEVHILINEELPEDEEDDEYVPHEEESEDEKESCQQSDADSQPATPATPASTLDNSTQTIWTEDGVFKVPQSPVVPKTPSKDQVVESTENIALRTRSKLSLSDTPLEIIEEAFIPPDITTDMYDFECDDEDWKEFLKKFTRPLDEAVTHLEDEDEADPEYNVLSDEEVDDDDDKKLDKQEELRQDKGVKISKKELNTLVAELFEFSEMFTNAKEQENNTSTTQTENNQPPPDNIQVPEQTFTEIPAENYTETICPTYPESQETFIPPEEPCVEQKIVVLSGMSTDQLMLFEQQMRQHVQMLTQNYLLTYKHIYLNDMSSKFKDMLLSLDELSKYRVKSAFRPQNLIGSIDFITEWEKLIASDSKEVQDMLLHVNKVATDYRIHCERNLEYVVTFPPLLMKKVLDSPIFIYPSLLPKIPFRYSGKKAVKRSYFPSENQLIALGLEQFREYLKDKPLYRTRNGLLSNLDVCNYICEYMMPFREPKKLYWYIQKLRYTKDPNPINFYFTNKKAPTAMHFVSPLEQFGVLPPSMRAPEALPYQWKNFLYPTQKPDTSTTKPKSKRVTKPPAYKKPAKKTKIKISQPLIPIAPDNKYNTPPLLIINNIVPVTPSSEVKQPPTNRVPKTNLDETPKILNYGQTKRKKLVLPKVEQIFIKTEDYFIANNSRIINQFQPSEISVCGEPPPVSNIEQIKKFTPELLNVKFNSSIFKKIKDIDMLPSMPFLQTPVKDPNNVVNDPEPEVEIQSEEDPLKISTPEGTKSDINKALESSIIILEENETIEQHLQQKKDDEDELNALMVASSTMQQKNRRLQPNLTKKAKQMREYNATLAMLCPENPNISEEKANNFAQAFYDKVQDRLESDSPLDYQKFMEALSEHDETRSTVSDLYDKVSSVLSPKHPDLCDEFLTFLTPEQAQQIGKLVPHFMMSNMSLFLRKLEIYYSNQPAQLRRIFNSLTELANTADITMDKVKSTILPLLKGNTLLIDWFLQMFPQEPPPESLITDWEEINCEDEEIKKEDTIFETLTLPEVEDPYGGPNCICKCHEIDNEMYKSRARHCIPCGTKFLQGRVYVQTGKGLRLANVTFNSPDSDHIKRLSVKPTVRQKRKSETSPSKVLMSPTKDDEPRHSNESEDDVNTENTQNKKVKSLNILRTNSPNKTRKKPIPKTPKIKKEVKKKSEPTPKKSKQTKPIKKTEEAKKETKNESENEEIESMDTCEESSQDTLEESDDSIEIETENSEDSNSPPELEISESQSWTREEDKVILQTFQKCGDNDDVYKHIQKLLPERKEGEIKQRFQVLMNLLSKMSDKS